MIDKKELIRISDMNISEVTETELEAGLRAVIIQRKDTIESIYQSMINADEAWFKYTDENYEPSEDEAKKDRAILNKAEKNIAEKYSEFKAAYDNPLQNIEANIKSIRNAIKDASSVVDQSVKAYEEKQKTKKIIEVESYFYAKGFNLLPLEKIFNHKWLNKTCKMIEVKKEIDDTILMIYNNIKILENIGEFGNVAKAFYLDTLDMGAAMRRVISLKENAEKLAKEKIEREERELMDHVNNNAKEEEEEKINEKKLEEFEVKQKRFYGSLGFTAEKPAEAKPEIVEYTLRFKGTKEQLFKLREYMTANKIAYEKLN